MVPHRSSLILFLVLLSLPSGLAAQNSLMERTRDFGISAGYIFEGSAYFAEDEEYSAHTAGPMIRVFYDSYIMEKFAVGLYSQAALTDFPRYTTDSGAILVEAGFSFKPRFFVGENMAVKPGMNIGYRYYLADDEWIESDGLGLNLGVEFQYDTGASYLPFMEVGFLSQPWGGNEETDITYDPIVYLQAGIAF